MKNIRPKFITLMIIVAMIFTQVVPKTVFAEDQMTAAENNYPWKSVGLIPIPKLKPTETPTPTPKFTVKNPVLITAMPQKPVFTLPTETPTPTPKFTINLPQIEITITPKKPVFTLPTETPTPTPKNTIKLPGLITTTPKKPVFTLPTETPSPTPTVASSSTPAPTPSPTPLTSSQSTLMPTPTQVPVNKAPNVTNVVLSGSSTVGKKLTVSYSYVDFEQDQEGSTIVSWYQADNSEGLNKELVQSATKLTYTLTNKDIGKYIIVEITPFAKTGTLQGIIASKSLMVPIKDSVHVKIVIKGSKANAINVGKIIKYTYAGYNIVVSKEGKYYIVSADFINNKVVKKVCTNKKIKKYIKKCIIKVNVLI